MDSAALTDLIRRHARLIRKIAWAYCRDATDREDVVQEVSVQLWRSRDRYDERFRETTWIYRIALNVAISYHRRERRHRDRRMPLDVDALSAEVAPDPQSREDVQLLRCCIEDLGEIDRALVVLHLEGNDHATIAEVLGISVSNVGTKLLRIKDKLRVAIERREVEQRAVGQRAVEQRAVDRRTAGHSATTEEPHATR